jgi:hypothetical protein
MLNSQSRIMMEKLRNLEYNSESIYKGESLDAYYDDVENKSGNESLIVDKNIIEQNRAIKRSINAPKESTISSNASDATNSNHQLDKILKNEVDDVILNNNEIVHLCCYRVFRKYSTSVPYMGYLMCTGTVSNEEVYTFPYFLAQSNDNNYNLQQYVNIQMEDILGLYNTANYVFSGYLQFENEYYVFLDIANTTDSIETLESVNNEWIYVLPSDIIYKHQLFERNFPDYIVNLFVSQPLLSLVFDHSGRSEKNELDIIEDGFFLPITAYKYGNNVYEIKEVTGYGPYYEFMLDVDEDKIHGGSNDVFSRVVLTYKDNVVCPLSAFIQNHSSVDEMDNDNIGEHNDGDNDAENTTTNNTRKTKHMSAHYWYTRGDILFLEGEKVIVKNEESVELVNVFNKTSLSSYNNNE